MPFLSETSAVIAVLTPFLPYLYEGGKSAGEIILKETAQFGGKAALEKAKSIWGYLRSKFSDNSKLEKTAEFLLQNPTDEDFIDVFQRSLDKYLQKNPRSLEDLRTLLGGPDKIQEIIAEANSKIENVKQEMSEQGGQQTIKAKDKSVIKGVSQKQ